MSNNLKAFLDMLAFSEGTAHLGDNGYNVLVGGDLFHSYADHPRKSIRLNRTLWSTAAGRYQILQRIYDHYKRTLNLSDFSPDSQDKIAIQLIRERKALDLIEAGNFELAIARVSNIWASLPGNNYGQHTHPLETLRKVFQEKGGTVV